MSEEFLNVGALDNVEPVSVPEVPVTPEVVEPTIAEKEDKTTYPDDVGTQHAPTE